MPFKKEILLLKLTSKTRGSAKNNSKSPSNRLKDEWGKMNKRKEKSTGPEPLEALDCVMNEKNKSRPGTVAQAYNPSTLGG